MHPMENVRLKSGGPPPNGNTVREVAAIAEAGMILLDLSLKPIAFDSGASAILRDPQDRNADPALCLPKEVLETIRNHNPNELSLVKTHFRLGKREYTCRAYLLESQIGTFTLPILALHLERDSSYNDALNEVIAAYHLTSREQEALRGISVGLTSKELAERMNISPNTVKAFLRLIMIKMGVTTRAGIVAKLLEHNNNGNRS
ncbi:MAG TPA: LuxR C-terminal-related transcriptional regulator [Bryobacteraceae bacterium]|jgi:DNA-binding CsgD family transcriptional regulator|nr:LuxR C-terminal-related transcriptional regulator [Bryobacteraceae bacterium]